MNEEHVEMVERAYHFAAVAHADQHRKSGEAYIIHQFKLPASGQSAHGSRNGMRGLYA